MLFKRLQTNSQSRKSEGLQIKFAVAEIVGALLGNLDLVIRKFHLEIKKKKDKHFLFNTLIIVLNVLCCYVILWILITYLRSARPCYSGGTLVPVID